MGRSARAHTNGAHGCQPRRNRSQRSAWLASLRVGYELGQALEVGPDGPPSRLSGSRGRRYRSLPFRLERTAALSLSRYRVGVSMASPRRSLPFQCADDASSILGAHDGISSWMLHVGRERSGPEQRFVSAHERLHHELHSTTPWGFVMSVVGGQVRPEARMVWRWLAESCRTTHEVFATYFAVLLDDTNPQLLAGNRVYQGYQAVGEELRRHLPHRGVLPHLHVDALLRAAMAPRQLLSLSPEVILRLRLPDCATNGCPTSGCARSARCSVRTASLCPCQGRTPRRITGTPVTVTR